MALPPKKRVGRVEQVHRPAAPAAAALDLPLELGHGRAHGHAPGQRVAVLAVGGHHGVVGLERLHDADGAGLLADREMEEATDPHVAVELDAALLEAPDPDHLAQQVETVPARASESDPAGGGDGVGHGTASSVECRPRRARAPWP